MVRRFFAALALAHSAAALLDGFVDVLVQVDEVHVPANLLSGMLQAAGSDDGIAACRTADTVINSCYDAGYLDPTAAVDDGNRCLCCDGTSVVSAVYSSCASYARNDDDPDATSVYEVVSEVYSICKSQVTCGTSGSARATSARATSTRRQTTLSLPPACSSLQSIYSSCAAIPSIYTAGPKDVAACFCPEQSGTINKSFQDYASSCAPFARSSYKADYSVITQLETFCDANGGALATTNPLLFSTVGTRTDGGFGSPSITSSPTSSSTPASAGTAGSSGTTSTSTGLAAPGLAVPGVAAWFANLATLFLSFFIMI